MRQQLTFSIVILALVILAVLLVRSPQTLVAQQLATPTLVFSPHITDLITGRGVVTAVVWDAGSDRFAVGGSAGIWIYTDTLEEIVHLQGPTYGVTALDWSADSSRLAAGGLDGTCWIWETATFQPVAVHETIACDNMASLAWNSDGSKLASSPFYGPPHIIDASTGAVLVALDDPASEIYGYPSTAWSLSWHPEQDWVVGATCPNGLYVWDAATGAVIWHVSPDATCAYAAAWSPDGSQIATSGDTMWSRTDRPPGIWDVATKEQVVTFAGYSEQIYALAWSPDGDRIATWGADETVRVEDAHTGHTLATLEGSTFSGDVASCYDHALAWSPDGRLLAHVGVDGYVRVWDMTTYELLNAWQGFNGLTENQGDF